MTPTTPSLIKLNDAAWRGLPRRYRDVVSPCTEAPDVFHLASFIAAVGCLVGRKAWVCCPHRTYPNFYCLLVGKTATARKSTAYQFALDLFEQTKDVLYDPLPKRLNGLASPEGLALAMRQKGFPEPHRILCVEDEFRSLVTKGGQKAVANLIPKLTELFNCPSTFEVNTKNDPILVQAPFLCMLAASTRAWFEESLTQTDVSGGFLNRWLLYEGEAEKLLPSPPPVDQHAWDDLVLDVGSAIHNGGGYYQFSRNAESFYASFYQRARTNFESEATSRTDLHARKLGLLYAVMANRKDRLIHTPDIESGVAIAEYCARIVEPIASALDLSWQRRLEERLMARVNENPGIAKRDLYRKLHVGIKELHAALGPLKSDNMIVEKNGTFYPG
jgi:hypothetical protein